MFGPFNPYRHIPYFQQGGPLYVSDPNDPRLKAYQDSLSLYTNYRELESELKKQGYKNYKGAYVDSIYGRLKSAEKTGIDVRKESDSLSSVDDFVHGVVNPTLPRQLLSYDIKPIRTDSWGYPKPKSWFSDDIRRGDARIVANYENVDPKQEVILNMEDYPNMPSGQGEYRRQISKMPQKNSPIYVTDPNDPRLRSYQDSMYAFNNVPMEYYDRIGDSVNGDTIRRPTPEEANALSYRGIAPMSVVEYRRGIAPNEFEHPFQEVILKQPKRDKESVDRLPSSGTPQLESTRTITAKRAPNPYHEEGEHTIPWENVPNLSIIMRRNKGKSDYTPWAIENTMGKRISYKQYRDGKLPKGFQHPEGMRLGGIPHFPDGGTAYQQGLDGNIDTNSGNPTASDSSQFPGGAYYNYGLYGPGGSGLDSLNPLSGLFGDLMTGEQGYQDFLSRQGNDRLNAQPGFFGFQRGGMVNDRAMRGYSDGSPYRNSPSINIPGNNINMNNTSMPLMLLPNQGRPTMAPPRSGSYYFPGASNVQEIPMRQMGGTTGMNAFFNNPEAMARAQAYSDSQPVEAILRPKNDPWEYKQTDSGYQTRKKGSDKWITVTEKTNEGAALPNVDALFNNRPLPYRVSKSGKATLNQEAVRAATMPNALGRVGGQGMIGSISPVNMPSPQIQSPQVLAGASPVNMPPAPNMTGQNLFTQSPAGAAVSAIRSGIQNRPAAQPQPSSTYDYGIPALESKIPSLESKIKDLEASNFFGDYNRQIGDLKKQVTGLKSKLSTAQSSQIKGIEKASIDKFDLDQKRSLLVTDLYNKTLKAPSTGVWEQVGSYDNRNIKVRRSLDGKKFQLKHGNGEVQNFDDIDEIDAFLNTLVKPNNLSGAFVGYNPPSRGSKVFPTKYQMGGQVEDNEPIEVQTEQGEVIAFQDGTLVPVKAKKSHKKMDKDEVTDVLPKGTYIFSKDKRMTFRPEQRIGGIALEDLVIGKSVVQYSEIEPTPAPEEITLGKILTKKMTSADMANKVRVMFPVTDREKDPFARWANDENKQSRLPYLEALVAISETKRPKKVQKFQYGGVTKLYDDKTLYGMAAMDNVMKRDNQLTKGVMLPSNILSTSHSMGLGSSKFFPRTFQSGGVPKAQTGLDIFGQIAGPLIDLGFGIFDRAKGNKLTKQTLSDIATNQSTTTGYLNQARNIGQAGNILNYGLQNTAYDFLDTTPLISATDNTYGQVLRSIQADKSSAQQLPLGQANSFARYASGSGMSPTQIGNYAGQIGAQGIGQSNQTGLQYNQMYNNTLLGQGATTRGYQREMIGDRQTGRNYMIGAENQKNANLVQGMVGTQNNYLQGRSDLDMQTLAAKMAARGQQMNFMTNNGMRIGDAATNLGNGLYNAVRPPYDPYGTNMRHGQGNAGGYSTPNWGGQVPYSGDFANPYNPGFLPPMPPGYNRWEHW